MHPLGDRYSLAETAERVRILWTMAGTRGTDAVTLGAQMRDARKKYMPDSTVRSICEPLGVKHPTVSRWETGERAPRSEDVAAFMAVIGAPAELRETLIDMARDMTRNTSRRPFLEDQGKYAAMLEIERTAQELVAVAPVLLPGMLQSEDYARAVYAEAGIAPEQIATRVAVRLGRQAALTRRTNPLPYIAYVWEPVLYAQVGGDDGAVLRDALEHLLAVAERPNVTVRIIPLRASWNPGWEGPYSVATFPESVERRPVVQLENKVSALYYDQEVEVARYLSAIARAEEVAIHPPSSSELIANVLHG